MPKLFVILGRATLTVISRVAKNIPVEAANKLSHLVCRVISFYYEVPYISDCMFILGLYYNYNMFIERVI